MVGPKGQMAWWLWLSGWRAKRARGSKVGRTVMACIYCQICDRYIDLDWDVDHEEDCAWEHGLGPEPSDD